MWVIDFQNCVRGIYRGNQNILKEIYWWKFKSNRIKSNRYLKHIYILLNNLTPNFNQETLESN